MISMHPTVGQVHVLIHVSVLYSEHIYKTVNATVIKIIPYNVKHANQEDPPAVII